MPPRRRPRQAPAVPRSSFCRRFCRARILCITAERRDVLCRIFPYVDRTGRDGRRCRAACIVLDGHGDDRQSLYAILFTIILSVPYCALHKICIIFFICQFALQTKLPNTFYISRRKHFSNNFKLIIPSQLI